MAPLGLLPLVTKSSLEQQTCVSSQAWRNIALFCLLGFLTEHYPSGSRLSQYNQGSTQEEQANSDNDDDNRDIQHNIPRPRWGELGVVDRMDGSVDLCFAERL